MTNPKYKNTGWGKSVNLGHINDLTWLDTQHINEMQKAEKRNSQKLAV